VADKLDEMDAVVAGSLTAEPAQPDADLTIEEPSEGLSFTADEEIGFDTIDLGGDGEVDAAVDIDVDVDDEEVSAESDIDDVIEAELDLDADEDHEAAGLSHLEGLVDGDDDDNETDEEA